MKIYTYPNDRTAIERNLARRKSAFSSQLLSDVQTIITKVKKRGNRALIYFSGKFDKVKLTPEKMRVQPRQLKKAWDALSPGLQKTFKLALRRINAFHIRQRPKSWSYRDKDAGMLLSEKVYPLERVGLYVPGGLAAYPSTVFMNTVPALIAGVPEIVLVTPPSETLRSNQATLAAAYLAGIREVYQVGGVQAIAALTYGTETIKPVDKIVGPGNAYVQAAKKLVYGTIDIDSIAGPSEILVIADTTAPPDYVAADMLSQAEHGPDSTAIAITVGDYDIPALKKEIARQTRASSRKEYIRSSLSKYGLIIKVRRREDAIVLANRIAPEHLEIMCVKPDEIASGIRNAGAIFVGNYTPEALGDYLAGSNHTLPTSGTARFLSPLSVWDFVKKTNVIKASRRSLAQLGPDTIRLAELEDLPGHANSVRTRL